MVVLGLFILSIIAAGLGLILFLLGVFLFKRVPVKVIFILAGLVCVTPFVIALLAVGGGMAKDAGHKQKNAGPFFMAVESGDLNYLKRHTNDRTAINMTNTNLGGRTPLIHAAERGRLEIMKLLVESGAYIDARDDNGYDALAYSAKNENREWAASAVHYLLGKGAKINGSGAGKRHTALHAAVYRNDASLAAELIRLGADVGIRDTEGETPLHIAARGRSVELVRLLLENGADVNAANHYRETPFSVTCGYFNYADSRRFYREIAAIFYYMLKRRPDVNVTDSWGNTVLDSVGNGGYAAESNVLVKLGATNGRRFR